MVRERDKVFMIRAEFKQLLMDQRGAAVILWSCFTISIGVYLVISRNVLANPKFAQALSFAATARVVLWLLVIVDLGYYAYWKIKKLSPDAMIADAEKTKLLRALEEYQGEIEQRAAAVVSTYVTRKVVVFAIIEAIAVYGLVLGIIGRYLSDQYWLSALSLLLLIAEFPSHHSLARLLHKLEEDASGGAASGSLNH